MIPEARARPLFDLREAIPAQITEMSRRSPPTSRVMKPIPIQVGSSSVSPNSFE